MSEGQQQFDNSSPHTRNRRPGDHMTDEERRNAQDQFLEKFVETANVRAACLHVGIDRSLVYKWKERDEEFMLRFNQATEDANDKIRSEIYRRGIEGVEKPVVSMGKPVFYKKKMLTVREYSDNLLSLLAKARMPEFRDKTHLDVDANVSTNHKSDISQELRMLTGSQLAQFKTWLLEAKARNEQ
jgi:hypothetical protein